MRPDERTFSWAGFFGTFSLGFGLFAAAAKLWGKR